jgi:hypothetical protein
MATYYTKICAKLPLPLEAAEWAGDCSRPAVDAYCGGAVVIAADGADWLSPSRWIAERIEARKSVPRPGPGPS